MCYDFNNWSIALAYSDGRRGSLRYNLRGELSQLTAMAEGGTLGDAAERWIVDGGINYISEALGSMGQTGAGAYPGMVGHSSQELCLHT